ncbi:hypothetical protein [Rurimicrobium arvi]|uniref:PEP-CTERM protein-sorting domain-containing protein n=1 Tax=Rurimicrobium arvi TaxID=2049916 RepID=A0ABP8MSL9_9BACT
MNQKPKTVLVLRNTGLAMLAAGTALLKSPVPDGIKGLITGVGIGLLILALIAGRKKLA